MMSKKGLPTGKEWDRIVDDAFSSTDIHEFSSAYEYRKAEMQKGNTMDSNERKRTNDSPKKKIKWSAAAAMAAAVALVPASVLAINHIGSRKVPMTEGEVSVVVETELPDEPATEVVEPETEVAEQVTDVEDSEKPQLGIATLEITAEIEETCGLPQGIYVKEVTEGSGAERAGITAGDVITAIEDEEVFTVDEIKEILNRYSIGDTVKVTVCRDDSYIDIYVQLDGGKTTSEDERELGDFFGFLNKINKDDVSLVHVGDTISRDFPSNESVDITINSARYQDNFDGIHTDGCGMETDYSDYLFTDGRIHNEIRWSMYNDEDDSTTAVSTEDQIMKVLVLDVTYTNTGNADITYDSGIAGCICPNLLTEVDGNLTRPSFISKGGFLPENSLLPLMCDDMMFSFDSPSKNNNKNHVDIPVGESADIQLAFLVPEDNIGNVYINITGGNWEDSDDPIVDLCDVR